MKKVLISLLLFLLPLSLTACAGSSDSPKSLIEEGVAPYALTEGEQYLLQSFGMVDRAQILSFHAPKEAIRLQVNVYRLNGQQWETISDGSISLGDEREPMDYLLGTFAMQLQDDYAIDFYINTSSGQAAYRTEAIDLDSAAMASVKCFLDAHQEIKLNREIPVALMVYDSGTSMRSCSLQDYFDPSVFADMDLVQAVTLEFLDE